MEAAGAELCLSVGRRWRDKSMGGHIQAKRCVQHRERCYALGTWFKIKHFVSVFMPVFTHIDAIREGKREKVCVAESLTLAVYLTYYCPLIGVPQVCKPNNRPKRTTAAFYQVLLQCWWRTSNTVGNLKKGNCLTQFDWQSVRIELQLRSFLWWQLPLLFKTQPWFWQTGQLNGKNCIVNERCSWPLLWPSEAIRVITWEGNIISLYYITQGPPWRPTSGQLSWDSVGSLQDLSPLIWGCQSKTLTSFIKLQRRLLSELHS